MEELFTTNPSSLEELLKEAENGKLQLPDFQRSWVWDEDRILDLLASISRNFPIGALMTLETGGEVNFHPRPIQGVCEPTQNQPNELLLDGQQRITSIFQVAKRNEVVETTTVKRKKIRRWFYVDIQKAIDPEVDITEALFTVPENKKLKTSDALRGRLDLTDREKEFSELMFPISELFNWSEWQTGLITYLKENGTFDDLWTDVVVRFQEKFIKVFQNYRIPVISLGKSISKEAVCTVFEKVNTGGKALDAFELVTAMYAADGYKLRDDWYGDGKDNDGYANKIRSYKAISDNKKGVLSKVASTDFLQVISLYHTRDLRETAIDEGKQGKELPQVTGKRSTLLSLPLEAYEKYREKALLGFTQAAKFLQMMKIFRVEDLPYQTQVIPLAAILADIGDNWENAAVRQKLNQWYWCGVFGELYRSGVDTRIGLDFMQVPEWLNGKGEDEPKTVEEAGFRKERLRTMSIRQSAAYKGLNALLMKKDAKDFRSGQKFEHTMFFEETVDIHHIFPKKWCEKNKKDSKVFDSIVNKTPLSAKTNRIIGGEAPSSYLSKLEKGGKDFEGVPPNKLDEYLKTHLIDPNLLRTDNCDEFIQQRQGKLFKLVLDAMGKPSREASRNDDDNDDVSESE